MGDFGFSHTKLSWRLMLASALLPALVQCVMLYFFLPETPRWLAYYGKLEEATETMVTLNYDPADIDGDQEELVQVWAAPAGFWSPTPLTPRSSF